MGASLTSAGEIGDLYAALSSQLEQIVRLEVNAPECVVEDACQFAWDRLLVHRQRVRRETALPWLAKTAVREAIKLLGRQRRCLPLDAVVAGEPGFRESPADPEELVLQHEQLDSLTRLPKRQRQLLWLHAFGLSYAEIALHTGATVRTVERQLLRAKRAVRAAARDTPANPGPTALPAAPRRQRSALAA